MNERGTSDLQELAAHLKALFRAPGREFDFVVRDACAADVLIKEPIHGMTTFQIHFRSHDCFHFPLKLGVLRGACAYLVSIVRISLMKRASGSGEFGCRSISWSIWMTQAPLE